MKAQELRIGNLVNFNIDKSYKQGEISSLSKNKAVIQGTYNTIYGGTNGYQHSSKYNNIEGIPITEEWLTKLGFEKFNYENASFFAKNHNDKPELRLFIKNDGLCHCSLGDNQYGVIFQIIKYVHQLQNIYFSINNKEL